MYEVFIDNKKILFTDSTKYLNNLKYSILNLEQLEFKNYGEFVKSLSTFDLIVVVSKTIETAWIKFVENFDLIEAAGGIVTFDDSFLAIYRNEKWDLPKGKLEKNEDPVLGAKREIEEECGVNGLIFIDQICNTFHTYDFKGIPILKKTYWYHFSISKNQHLTPQIEEGITLVSWVKIQNKQAFLNNTYDSIREVIMKFENGLK
jgi:ADP-ribose pyrophosphatase YjhB (NUDIX family)